MNKTGTILKAMQAVLFVTVLTPAISDADPLSTRMMLAQAQTQSQDQAVKGEVKKLNRGLILSTAAAATPSSVQRPVEIPQVAAPVAPAPATPAPVVATVEAPQIEIPALPPRNDDAPASRATNNSYSTAAVPASTTANSSVVTLPAPAATDVATTPAPVTAVSTPTPVTTTTVTTTTDAVKTDTAKTNATTAKPTSTRTAQASHPHHTRDHSVDSVNIGGVKLNAGNFSGQISKIMGRADVKSILSQYGLN